MRGILMSCCREAAANGVVVIIECNEAVHTGV
jgi:hypothetical protein